MSIKTTPYSLASLFLLLMALALPPINKAEAFQPLLTDDAEVSDVGEMSLNFWGELIPGGDSIAFAPLFNLFVSYSPIRALEFSLGLGLGLGTDREFTVLSPTLEIKTLLVDNLEWKPGIALAMGTHLPFGFGEAYYGDGWSFYLNLPVTFHLGEFFTVHTNLGWVSAIDDEFQVGRPFAGLAGEFHLPLEIELSLVGEFFLGDPGDVGTGISDAFIDGPYTGGGGLRWVPTETMEFDFGMLIDADLDWLLHFGASFYLPAPAFSAPPENRGIFSWSSRISD